MPSLQSLEPRLGLLTRPHSPIVPTAGAWVWPLGLRP